MGLVIFLDLSGVRLGVIRQMIANPLGPLLLLLLCTLQHPLLEVFVGVLSP